MFAACTDGNWTHWHAVQKGWMCASFSDGHLCWWDLVGPAVALVNSTQCKAWRDLWSAHKLWLGFMTISQNILHDCNEQISSLLRVFDFLNAWMCYSYSSIRFSFLRESILKINKSYHSAAGISAQIRSGLHRPHRWNHCMFLHLAVAETHRHLKKPLDFHVLASDNNNGPGGWLRLFVEQAGGQAAVSLVQARTSNSGNAWTSLDNVYGSDWEIQKSPNYPLDISIVGPDGQTVSFHLTRLPCITCHWKRATAGMQIASVWNHGL